MQGPIRDKEVLSLITELRYNLYLRTKGGQGSGGWGHAGRTGKRGGSRAGSSGLSKIGAKPGMHPHERKKLAKKVTEEKRLGRKAKTIRIRILTVERKATEKLTKLEKEREIAYARYAPFKERTVQLVDMVIDGKISMSEYKKRDIAIKKESGKAAKDIQDFHAKENEIFDSVIKKQRKLIYAKEGPANIDIEYWSDFDDDSKEQLRKGVDEFSKIIGRGTALDTMGNIPIFDAPTGRSSVTGDTVRLSKAAGVRTTIHEFSHLLEHASRNMHTDNVNHVHKQASDFLEMRTKGEKAKKLNAIKTGDRSLDARRFNDAEMVKPDKFSDPYTGKIYEHGATEIISMGIEQMWENPGKFSKTDPEYFDFIYATLEGARTYTKKLYS